MLWDKLLLRKYVVKVKQEKYLLKIVGFFFAKELEYCDDERIREIRIQNKKFATC